MLNLSKKQRSTSDLIAILYLALLLLIDFLPYFKSLEIINPQFLYLSCLNLLLGIYLYFNTDKIPFNVAPYIGNSYIFKIYAVFLFFCGISFFAARNTSLVITKVTELLIVFCLFINLVILLRDKLHLIPRIILIVAISAFFQSFQQLQFFLIAPKGSSVIDLLNSMKGNTGNINILAASLTIKVPFLLFGVTRYNNYKVLIFIIALFTTTCAIFLTGARTPLINLFFIFIIYITYYLKQNSFAKSVALRIGYLLLPVLLAAFLSNFIFKKSEDKGRYVSIENRVTQINTEDASSRARLTFWKNAAEIIKKHPVFGIGLGNYQVESIPYERTTANGTNVSLHTHNDFLEIMSETGIINGLVYLSLFIYLLFVNCRNIVLPDNKTTRDISILILMMLIVYGVDSFFNFPMYRPTMQIFFALMLALSLITNSKVNTAKIVDFSKNKILFAIVISIGILTSCSAYIIYKASNLEYLIATDDINVNDTGVLNGDEVVKRMPAFPTTFGTSESFYEYAGIYYIREKKYDKALNCFSKASKINPYLGRIDFYKYVICNEKGNIDSAYVYSKRAFYLRPRNELFYKTSVNLAGLKKDTLEIFKQHRLFSQYIQNASAWTIASKALQTAGVKQEKLIDFINIGLRKIPGDSILIKQKNDFLITDYLVKGQNYEAQSDFDKALQTYKKGLKVDPNNIYVLQNIGFWYFNRGMNKEAIGYLLKALRTPGLYGGQTEYILSLCYKNNNDPENACKYFAIAKSLNYSRAQNQNMQNCP